MWAGFTRTSIRSNNIVLCVSGLENLFPGGAPLFVAHFTLALRRVLCTSVRRPRPHYYLVTLLSRLISSPVRLLTRYLLHLSYDWSLCLSQLTPAYWCDFVPFHSGCHRPSSSAFCRFCCLCWLWVRINICCFLSFCLPRSLNRCASACHSSINRLSGLRPVF